MKGTPLFHPEPSLLQGLICPVHKNVQCHWVPRDPALVVLNSKHKREQASFYTQLGDTGHKTLLLISSVPLGESLTLLLPLGTWLPYRDPGPPHSPSAFPYFNSCFLFLLPHLCPFCFSYAPTSINVFYCLFKEREVETSLKISRCG